MSSAELTGTRTAAVHLTAAVIPDHIGTQIQKFRLHLFRQFGLSSARALPPFVPLLFTENPVHKDYLETLLSPEDISITPSASPVLVGNSWFLQLSPRHAVPRPQLKPRYRNKEPGILQTNYPSLPPIFPGIFIAAAELSDLDIPDFSMLESILGKPFRLSKIMDIALEMQDENCWWCDVNFSMRKIISLR